MLEQPRHPVARKPDQAAAVKAAEALCGQRGAQMTTLRRAVLEALWRADQPLGAYDLLSRIEASIGRKSNPQTIYRVLGFFLEHRLVARIESEKAYVPCAHPERPHACVFFVCDQCSASVEVENAELEALVDRDARSLGFRVARRVIELRGTCAECLSTQADETV